jgi:hypothetical protein
MYKRRKINHAPQTKQKQVRRSVPPGMIDKERGIFLNVPSVDMPDEGYRRTNLARHDRDICLYSRTYERELWVLWRIDC